MMHDDDRQLLNACLNGEIADAQRERLEQRLVDDAEFRRLFVRETHAEKQVRDALATQRRIRQEADDLASLANAVGPFSIDWQQPENPISPRVLRIAWSAAAAACLMLSATVFLLIQYKLDDDRRMAQAPAPSVEITPPAPSTPTPTEKPFAPIPVPQVAEAVPTPERLPETASNVHIPVAVIARPIPGMWIVRDREKLDVKPGTPIFESDLVVTKGFQLFDPDAVATTHPLPGAAVRYYGESTQIILSSGTEARFYRKDGSKRIELFQGRLLCDVSRQRDGMPMTLLTPTARFTVLGTKFQLASDADRTRLSLNHGKVLVSDREGLKPGVETTTGQYAEIDASGAIALGTLQSYQAEDATLFGAVAARNHAGFSGDGFVDFMNPEGDYVEWQINVPATGRYRLRLRYSHGASLKATGPRRPLDIAVNGLIVQFDLNFPSTGAWENWKYNDVEAELKAGLNTVRATAIGYSGVNIDRLDIEPAP